MVYFLSREVYLKVKKLVAHSYHPRCQREVTVIELQKIAALFNTSIDKVVNFDGDFPKEVILEDKNTVEQMRLIQQLDEDDKTTVLKIIDKMLTTKKFKEFFKKNVAML